MTPSWAWVGLLILCVLADVSTGVAINEREHAIDLKIHRKEMVARARQDAKARRGLAGMARLRPDDPVERWLPFSQADTSEVAMRAWEASGGDTPPHGNAAEQLSCLREARLRVNWFCT